MKRWLLMIVLLGGAANVLASSDAAWAALYERTERTCLKKSGLRDAQLVGERVVFSKHILYRIEGRYPQPHMQGQHGNVYCLHPYPKGRVEIVEDSAP